MSRWYYQVMGEEIGPVTSLQLKTLAADTVVLPDTLVRIGNSGEWTMADRVKGLFPKAETPLITNEDQGIGFEDDDRDDASNTEGVDSAERVSIRRSREIHDATSNVALLVQRATSLKDIFDFKFEKYVTPLIVRATWIMAIVVSGLWLVYFILSLLLWPYFQNSGNQGTGYVDRAGMNDGERSFVDDPGFVGTAIGLIVLYGVSIVAAIVGVAFALLWLRVALETVIVIFNMASTLADIRDRIAIVENTST